MSNAAPSPLTALSPLDGRYHGKVAGLSGGTGASMSLATKELLEFGQPKQIHFATAIASAAGLDHIRRIFPDARVWMAALDEELTGKAYIVPGLGDAGDLSYGDKGGVDV